MPKSRKRKQHDDGNEANEKKQLQTYYKLYTLTIGPTVGAEMKTTA